MAVNLSSLSPITTSATALSNLILVTPQENNGYQPQSQSALLGQTQQAPPKLLFNYEGEQTVSIQSDITDHFVEDNTALQDQISLKPEAITTNGFIGELNDVVPDLLRPLKTIADKLTVVTAYTPLLTLTAQIAYNEALLAYQTAQDVKNAAVSAWTSITNQLTPTTFGPDNLGGLNNASLIDLTKLQTKQQVAFQQFYAYWRNRTLFTVQTPWGIFSNCAILSLRAVQDPDTRMVSNFEVTFKLIRFATTTILPSIGANQQGRAAVLSSNLTDLGSQTGIPDISVQTGLSQNFPGSFPNA